MARSNQQRPTFEREAALWQQGFRAVAGVDEAGRGPLAGPVVAAAVVLPAAFRAEWLPQVRDSKLLTARQRQLLDRQVRASGAAVATGEATVEEIDRLNIAAATRLAMLRAVMALPAIPDFVLIDGRERLALEVAQQSVIDGDARCLSIATASIVAKVHRDALMDALDADYPGWGFARHKGYPSAAHRARLVEYGPLPVHRRSYAPVRRLLGESQG